MENEQSNPAPQAVYPDYFINRDRSFCRAKSIIDFGNYFDQPGFDKLFRME